MPWITKPSGTMKVARRNEPYLTPEIRAGLERDILPRYEKKQGALLPTLHAVQHRWGWLPWQALEEIAAFLGLSPAEVWDTASFYEEYWLQPKGSTLIAVCRSIACECRDHTKVTEACKARLGIDVGDTTDDGKFTLVEVECLGSCDTAPVALFNHTLHENLTPEGVSKLIDGAAAGEHHH
ncbi:MAG: NADH-quinone oxidoreductase subunit NuoE [Phycisphaerae bacterium]|nr:NADH-quinone oxidoreductase subunit NuoE [Phycisphaerae bacterium]